MYPSAGLSTLCFPYCGPNEPYSQPFVMVKFSGVTRAMKTATVCSVHDVDNVGDTLNTVQQRDKLASTSFTLNIQ